LIYLILACFLIICEAYGQRSKAVQPENKITNYVTDKTGTLTPSQIQSLESKLANFDKEASTQIVVWMVSSLEGESLEEKSIEIAEQNGIGQKGKDNGALLFIAKDDKRLRIEVGYGLEGALPDALCDQIIRKEITPQFKQGKFYEGINAGVDAMIKTTRGEYTREKSDDKDTGAGGLLCGIPILFLVFGFFFVFVFIIPIFRRIFGWGGGRSNWWHTGGSGWSGGSSWSGGGFSGGGGSFGGGGASGSW
jgi:uncharacterized protein